MAGNSCQDLNSNPFTTGVQLHRTTQASTRPTISTATHNADVADEDMSNGIHAEVNNPLTLGGYLHATAMTSLGERVQQASILAPQAQTGSAGLDASINIFCLGADFLSQVV